MCGDDDTDTEPNFSSAFAPAPATPPGGLCNAFLNPRTLGMPVPTFLGGQLCPGRWHPAEPVLGNLHQAPGRGAFWCHQRFSPPGISPPEVETALQGCGGGDVLLIRGGTGKGNVTRLGGSREITKTLVGSFSRALRGVKSHRDSPLAAGGGGALSRKSRRNGQM